MATNQITGQLAQPIPRAEAGAEALAESWYALHTRSRHEKMVAQRLAGWGGTTFLPMVTEVRGWRDRKKSAEWPLFGCYMFAQLAHSRNDRLRVLGIDGVLRLVGARGEGSPIPDEQVDGVRRLVESE